VKVCSVESCDGIAKARGLCNSHYERARTGRNIDGPIRRWGSAPQNCSVDGCDGSAASNGLCDPHYRRQKAGQPLVVPLRKKGERSRGAKACMFDGCDDLYVASGYCDYHYRQHKRGAPLTQRPKSVPCHICGEAIQVGPSKRAGKRVHKECKNLDYQARRYGLDFHAFKQLNDQQGGLCAICGEDRTYQHHRRLSIDHDHETGAVRGLLCPPCNHALGFVADSERVVVGLLSYLIRASLCSPLDPAHLRMETATATERNDHGVRST
jgi:hypothetical protein